MKAEAVEAAERIAAAIEGRNPKGYSEVFAVDVLALESEIDPSVNNGVPDVLVKGAKGAVEGMKPERAADVKVNQLTGQLSQLLGALKHAEPVR